MSNLLWVGLLSVECKLLIIIPLFRFQSQKLDVSAMVNVFNSYKGI